MVLYWGLSSLTFLWTICCCSWKSVVYTIMQTTIPLIHRPKMWQMYHTIWDMMAVKMACKANPNKFHLMLFSPTPTDQQVLKLSDDRSLMAKTEVTVLGVTIDDELCFSQHTNVFCKKAARQLNALVRISKHLNINSHRTMYNSFIMNVFNYCRLVRHFCCQINNQKLEKIQQRALRIVFADYNSSYMERLKKAGTTILFIRRLCLIALTVFKSLDGLNPLCLNDIVTTSYYYNYMEKKNAWRISNS